MFVLKDQTSTSLSRRAKPFHLVFLAGFFWLLSVMPRIVAISTWSWSSVIGTVILPLTCSLALARVSVHR